jgi:uncharacterized membrane protein
METYHVGPTAATSLNGATFGTITLPKASRLEIQAGLFTSSGGNIIYRIAYQTALAATTLATAEGFLSHGGSVVLSLMPTQQAYLYWVTVDATGAVAVAGANDFIYQTARNS